MQEHAWGYGTELAQCRHILFTIRPLPLVRLAGEVVL